MVDEPDITMEYFGGSGPVQAWGTVQGKPFSFRARHDHWSFAVVLDPTVDPADIAHADQSFYREASYGAPGSFSASNMPHGEARAIIRRCADGFSRTYPPGAVDMIRL